MKLYSIPPRILQTLAWGPTRLLLNFFCHFEVRGVENLKGLSQAIFAVNHSSELDPIILTAALNPLGRFAPMFYIAGPAKFFNDKTFGWRRYLYTTKWFFRSWGAYPHIPGHKNYAISLQHHKEILNDGGSICIFPEGWKTRDGELQVGHGGVAFLSHSTNIPIVPTAIAGAYSLSTPEFLKRKRKIVLCFGTPINTSRVIPLTDQPLSAEVYRVGAQIVMKSIKDGLMSI